MLRTRKQAKLGTAHRALSRGRITQTLVGGES